MDGHRVALGYNVVCAVLYLGIPDWFLTLHTAFAASDFAEVRSTTILLLRFAAMYCIFDAVQIVLIGALRGRVTRDLSCSPPA